MKKVGQLLDTIGRVLTAKVVIVVLLGVMLAVIAWLGRFASTSIDFPPLPILVVVLAAVLMLYPLIKLLEWMTSIRSRRLFKYQGLLWRSSVFSFRDPSPICPEENCGREVICIRRDPPNSQVISSITDLQNFANRQITYTYECPVHGQIRGIENVDIQLLQMKAKMFQR